MKEILWQVWKFPCFENNTFNVATFYEEIIDKRSQTGGKFSRTYKKAKFLYKEDWFNSKWESDSSLRTVAWADDVITYIRITWWFLLHKNCEFDAQSQCKYVNKFSFQR